MITPETAHLLHIVALMLGVLDVVIVVASLLLVSGGGH